jgi:hypothetical protein
MEAYIELSKMFSKADGQDPVFRQYSDVVRNLPAESNVAALEQSLACLVEFLKNADNANKYNNL